MDLRLEKLRTELIEQHRGGHAADGVLRRLIEEPTAVDRAVHVGVEKNQQFLIEIASGLSFHYAVSFRELATSRGAKT